MGADLSTVLAWREVLMKSVEIAPSIQADPRLNPLVLRATDVLERTVGPSSSPGVSAAWSLLNDEKARPLLRLEIFDFTGSPAPVVFAPDELKSDWQVEGRMLRLWGDLLQVRSHKQLEEILKSSSDPGAT